jgi:hypothetical protein
MQSFIYNQLAGRVIFGPGPLGKLPEEIARLGATRGLLRFPTPVISQYASAKGESHEHCISHR